MQLKAIRIVHWQGWLLFLMISTLIQGQLKAKPLQLDSDTFIMGGGCFWCIEPIMESLDGVMNATSGYAGGTSKAPTYKSICSGKTGHAEVVQVTYDKTRISLTQLLEVFFESHDPTTLNRQGADVGSQYRSIILYRTCMLYKVGDEGLGYEICLCDVPTSKIGSQPRHTRVRSSKY